MDNNRRDYVAEDQEEDMFFNAGRVANYAEQYTPSQRLKDNILGKNNDPKNNSTDDINLQKQLNKQQLQQQQQQQKLVQQQTPPPIRTSNNSNQANIVSNNNSNVMLTSNTTTTSSLMNRNAPISNIGVASPEVMRLPTIPSLPISIQSNSTTTPNEKTIPVLSSPGVIGILNVDQKRKISLQYLAEISNFSRKDVQDAMVSKVDNESGEIYGNIPEIIVGMKYSSRIDLLDSKLHTDLQSDICTNGNYIKPAPALIIYDTQERHEDRGTVVLYSIPFHTDTPVDVDTVPSIKRTSCEALAQNSVFKIPVRVIRGTYESSSMDDSKRFRNGHCPAHGYRYDGIYFVGEYFYEPGATSFVFKLIRIYGQPELPHTPNLSEPPARNNGSNNQRPPFTNNSAPQQQGPPPNMPNIPNNPNDRKIFGIPSFVTQRILSGSQDYLAQSTQNIHSMPFIPSIPQKYSQPNNSQNTQMNNSQNAQNPHSLPAMPYMPNMNFNRNNIPNNNNSNNMNTNNYNEPQNNRPILRNNQPNQQPFSGSLPNSNNTNGGDNGMNLTHTSVRQMINNLKFQNSNFGGRIQSYSYNISELSTKVDDVQKSMPVLGRQLTSRNKTFTWKLGQEKQQEEYDRSKYFVYDDEDASEEEEIEERPRSKKKKTQHASTSGSFTTSSRTTPNDSNSTGNSNFQLVSKKKTSGRPHKNNGNKSKINYRSSDDTKRSVLQNSNNSHKHEKSKSIVAQTPKTSSNHHSEAKSTVSINPPSVIIKQHQVSTTIASSPVVSYSAAVILNNNSTTTSSPTTSSMSGNSTQPNFYAISHNNLKGTNNSGREKKNRDSSFIKKPNEKNRKSKEQQGNKKIEKKHHQPQMVVRKVKITPQFFIIRKPLNQEDLYHENGSLKPIIPKEPEDEMGKSFHRSLKSFVEDKNSHVYDFPNTLNLNQRKRVHSLAEEFKLDHFSRGSNPFRYVCVSKRDMKMKDEFQYFGYIGLFGHSIDELVRKYTINPDLPSNQPLLQKRIKRDGPIHHITIMTRPEINTAIKNMDAKELEHLFNSDQKQKMKNGTEEEKIEILMSIISKVIANDYQALGLGKVTQKLSQFEGNKTDDINEAYFVIIDWPSAQKLRAILGLEPYNFHITVAYKHGDIHGVTKDKSTQVSSQVFEMTNELLQKKETEMENLLKYIGSDTRYAHSLITLGWFNPDSIATIEKMDLSDLGVSEDDQNKILSFVQEFSNNYKKYTMK